ncbi:hypothetical protein CEQ90_06850 [Lewinellaceae bacterium SD302]|nr:hypothetical protein CEQ90_06850 [Lewinellaceae bacterium SD302]
MRLLILISLATCLLSCDTTRKTSVDSTNNNQIWWVSGFKTQCSGGAGKMECLKVHKGSDLNDPEWEYFYSSIEGFEYEEGFLKKIELTIEELPTGQVPADASSLKYTLVRELEKNVDYRTLLNGEWTLTRLENNPINRSVPLPELTIDLKEMRINGTGGCNNYTGQIKSLTFNSIELSKIAGTRKACPGPTIENEYFKALGEVGSFRIKGNNLMLFNDGKELLAFMKQN